MSIREISINELNKIKSLWEKLNIIHLNDSQYFKEHYRTNTFEERCKKFYRIHPSNIKIMAVESDDKAIVGYCISTINREELSGEIESIYIENDLRQSGIGTQLINMSINWFKENNCKKINVSVAEGHESVFEFYKKFGFYPRLISLQLKC